MSFPKKVLRLAPVRGLAIDTPPSDVALEFWTGGQNVVFRGGFAERVKGQRSVYATVQDDVLNLINARSGATNYWVYHGTDKSYVVDSASTHTELTHASGLTAVDAAHQWSSTLLNGIVCSSNSLDAPMYWDGDVGNDFVSLPNWPAGSSCGKLVAFRYHLFALNMSESGGEYPMKLLWSSAAEPGTVPATWTAAADNDAGDASLSDTPGEIITAVPLRGSLLIYKTGSVYAADYIGGNDVFTFRLLFSNLGALTKRAVCDINGRHFVVTDGDIVITDGTNRESVATDRVRKYLFDALDQTNYEMLAVEYNRARNEAWIIFPESGQSLCTQALVYDISHDSWGLRDLSSVSCIARGIVDDSSPSDTWAAVTGTWADANYKWAHQNFSFATESILLGEPGTPRIVQVDTDDALDIESGVKRWDLHFGQPERFKFVKRVHARLTSGSGTMYLRIGLRNHPGDSIAWGDEVEISSTNQIANVLGQARYISIELRADGTEEWQVPGIDIEYELRGFH